MDLHTAKASELSMQDLSGEVLVMPIEGVSEELDQFREEIVQDYPSARIIDSNYYGVDSVIFDVPNLFVPYLIPPKKAIR